MNLIILHRRSALTRILLSLLLMIMGCGEPRETAESPLFERTDNRQVVMIVMDLSGSFAEKMADDGKAYKFAFACVNRYFRRSDPLNDRIILAQISGTEQSLLWEGTPLELRKDFPTASLFRDFLLRKADDSGSLVHLGVANAIDYLNSQVRFSDENTKSVALILSDMKDTSDDSDSQQRLNRALSDYGQKNGSVGIYFCHQLEVGKWKDCLADSGIRNSVVESEIVGEPTLPNFQ